MASGSGQWYSKVKMDTNPQRRTRSTTGTSEHVHVGPFRLVSFHPAFSGLTMAILGWPWLDTIRVRTFSDMNTLYSNLLAGPMEAAP